MLHHWLALINRFILIHTLPYFWGGFCCGGSWALWPMENKKTMIASGVKSNIACWNIRNILYLWEIFRAVDTSMALSEDFPCFPMIFWWFSHGSRNFHWLPKFTELHQGQLLTSLKRYACHLGIGWMIQKQHGNGELGSTIFSTEFKPFTSYFYGYKKGYQSINGLTYWLVTGKQLYNSCKK